MGRTNDQMASTDDQPPNSGLWGHVEVEALPNPGSLPPPPLDNPPLNQGTLLGFVVPQPTASGASGPTRRTPTAGTAQVRIGTKTLTAGVAPPVNLESTVVPQTAPIGVVPKDTMLAPGGQPQARGYYHANQATRTLIGGSLPAPESSSAQRHNTLNLAGARRATAPGFAALPQTILSKDTLVIDPSSTTPSAQPMSSAGLHPTERSPAAATSPEMKAVTQPSGPPGAEYSALQSAPATSHLGRFRIQKRLGSGGVGAVYLATKVDSAGGGHQLLAVKVLREHFYRDPSTLKALFREARLAARMDHRHIVRVFDIGYHNKHPYLVMEYVDGLSLTTLMTHSELPLAIGIRCLIDTLHGLDFAHKLRGDEGEPLGLVHCDVSPQNILVGVDGITKLTDFGVARTREEDGDEFVLRCKPEFAAPELLKGEPVRPESDVFSAGSVLYHIATGRPAFVGETEEEVGQKLLHDEPTPPTRLRQDLPEFLDSFCAQAMAKSPADRFKSCLEMARALERHAEAAGLLADRPTVGAWVQNVRRVMEHGDEADLMTKRPPGAKESAPPPPTIRESRPRAQRALGLVLFALMLLAGIGWWALSRNTVPHVSADETVKNSSVSPPSPVGSTAASERGAAQGFGSATAAPGDPTAPSELQRAEVARDSVTTASAATGPATPPDVGARPAAHSPVAPVNPPARPTPPRVEASPVKAGGSTPVVNGVSARGNETTRNVLPSAAPQLGAASKTSGFSTPSEPDLGPSAVSVPTGDSKAIPVSAPRASSGPSTVPAASGEQRIGGSTPSPLEPPTPREGAPPPVGSRGF